MICFSSLPSGGKCNAILLRQSGRMTPTTFFATFRAENTQKTGPKIYKSNDDEYEEGETEENVIWLLYLV